MPSAGLCRRVSLFNTDSVSAGPYTDILCIISLFQLALGHWFGATYLGATIGSEIVIQFHCSIL